MNLKNLQQRILTLAQFNFVLAIWLATVLNFSFYQKIHEFTPYSNVKSVLLLISTVFILISFYYLIVQWLSWKWSAKIVASILVIIGGFSAYFVNSLGVVITPEQIQNMIQTDVREVRDLWSIRLIIWSVIFVFLPLLFIWTCKLTSTPVQKLLIQKVLSSLVALGMIVILLFCFYVDYAAIFREHRSLKGMISPQNAIASTLSYYKKRAPKRNEPLQTYGTDARLVQNTATSNQPKLVVLVVGETARAESFSLNGYTKLTNPELAKQQIINFSNVSSCGTATAVSVPCMFSGMSQKNYDEHLAQHREGLLDVAQYAGYKVTWIDNNSGCKDVCNRVEQYQIPEDLKEKWCKDGDCHDEILVDSLQRYLQNIEQTDQQPRLIVLHQLGSHGPAYYKRSPPAYQHFKPTCDTNAIQGCSQQQLINSYDNSIVYTDHVLNQVIELLKKDSKWNSAFWYLSDHGESTGEHGLYLHGAPYALAPSQQTHIPMLMWFSETWKQQQPEHIGCLTVQKDQPLSQDYLFSSLLSLLDVTSNTMNPKYNLFSNCQKKLS